MISALDTSARRFLDAINAISDRMQRAQRQVGSGKRLEVPSDDPDSVSLLVTARSSLARLEQTQSNLSRLTTEIDSAEQAMQKAVQLFDRVRTLGMTGASGTQTSLTRAGIADELGTILQQLVGLANTQVDGRFVFSGDSDQAAAYTTFDLTQTPPWGTYHGTASTRRALDPTGVTFPIAKGAQEIFESTDPTRNVFQNIETLRQALLADDDAAITAALDPLANCSAHLNSILQFYGSVQSQISDATNTAAKLKLQLTSEKSSLEDADMTEAILELQQAQYQQQAALSVRASTPHRSLFDYLG
jgi:flagellar hook-associated protein 3 FlgL